MDTEKVKRYLRIIAEVIDDKYPNNIDEIDKFIQEEIGNELSKNIKELEVFLVGRPSYNLITLSAHDLSEKEMVVKLYLQVDTNKVLLDAGIVQTLINTFYGEYNKISLTLNGATYIFNLPNDHSLFITINLKGAQKLIKDLGIKPKISKEIYEFKDVCWLMGDMYNNFIRSVNKSSN